jgi:hypothetical protein
LGYPGIAYVGGVLGSGDVESGDVVVVTSAAVESCVGTCVVKVVVSLPDVVSVGVGVVVSGEVDVTFSLVGKEVVVDSSRTGVKVVDGGSAVVVLKPAGATVAETQEI